MKYKDLTDKEKTDLIGEYVYWQENEDIPFFGRISRDGRDCFISDFNGSRYLVQEFFSTLNELKENLTITWEVDSINGIYLKNEEEI